MRLKIVQVNFGLKYPWIYKLNDEHLDEFYIMNEEYYKTHKMKSPITKKELDSYDRGMWINAHSEGIENFQIITHVW